MSGQIPEELENYTKLRELYLNNNRFSGEIPDAIFKLENLEELNLRTNLLKGEISPKIGNLTNLILLSLSKNSYTGQIPAEIGNLKNLNVLFLSSNRLSGSIPAEIGNLKNLQFLFLDDNLLSGQIPAEIGNLNNLYGIYCDRNNLSGTLPPELSNLINLQEIYLDHNQISGDIPVEFAALQSLKYLNIANNNIKGGLENIHSNNLNYLNIQNNDLDFSDLEDLTVKPKKLDYAPQNFLGKPETIERKIGENFIIYAGDTYTEGNINRWYRGNELLNKYTTQKLKIDSLTEEDNGFYICRVTNNKFKDLTLYRHNVILFVKKVILTAKDTDNSYIICEGNSLQMANGLSLSIDEELQSNDDYVYLWEQIEGDNVATLDNYNITNPILSVKKLKDTSDSVIRYRLTITNKNDINIFTNLEYSVKILKKALPTWKTSGTIVDYNGKAKIIINSRDDWNYSFYDNKDDIIQTDRFKKIPGELTWQTDPLTETTSFWVEAYRTDLEECKEYRREIKFIILSIDDNQLLSSEINIYPNPATNYINIQLEPEFNTNIQIYNLLGIEVINETMQEYAKNHIINIEKLPAGIYYMKIGERVQRFMKM